LPKSMGCSFGGPTGAHFAAAPDPTELAPISQSSYQRLFCHLSFNLLIFLNIYNLAGVDAGRCHPRMRMDWRISRRNRRTAPFAQLSRRANAKRALWRNVGCRF
jgi:hypothetical protein